MAVILTAGKPRVLRPQNCPTLSGVNQHQEGLVTICEDVEGLPCCIQAGETGGFWGDGSPALERCLQRGGPVGDHSQRLPSYWHHLCPLWSRLVGVWLLDWRSGGDRCCQTRAASKHSLFNHSEKLHGNFKLMNRSCNNTRVIGCIFN